MFGNNTYTKDNWIFQEFLLLLGHLVHSNLLRQIDYLKVENRILRSKLGQRVNITISEKRRLIKYGLPLGGSIRNFISIVSYSTFRRWVSNGISKNKTNTARGRRRTPEEIRELIVRLAKENNWGYTRILGELKKLRIYSISRNTVKNILRENGLDPAPRRSEDTWDAFIKRHFKTLWACDFFTKTVWTMLGPKTFYCLFFINIWTRKVHIAGITKHPDKEWVNDKARAVSFFFKADDGSRKLLIRDSDTKFSREFDEIINRYGAEVKRIPYRSPNLNPYAEGWVGTIKRECLDYFFVFGEKHFRYLVKEYVKYYNTVRPHSSLDNMPINYRAKNGNGKLKCDSRLGGLIRHYYRE
ncbi:MAG: integrase core domain-containing protein [Candidatus Omnitrophota bacterium]